MADFTLSPGIVTTETDRSIITTTPNLTSVGGVVGSFGWGPAMIPTTITSETDMITQFGKPTSNNYVEWFNAYNFLQYGETLNVVRVLETSTAKNASFKGTANLLITNDTDYMDNLVIEEGGLKDSASSGVKFGVDTVYGPWIARFAGDLGNSISVDMCLANASADTLGLANTSMLVADKVNHVEFTLISDNKYTVTFSKMVLGVKTALTNPLMGAVNSHYEDRSDITTDQQSKVLTILYNDGVSDYEYNLLVDSVNPDGTLTAYVNEGSHGVVPDATVLAFHTAGTYLDSMIIRERSKYKEYSYGAVSGSPNNLIGSVYFDNNSTIINGVNTAFTKQVSVGDILSIQGQKLTVTSVVDDTTIYTQQVIVGKVLSSAPVSWTREWKYASTFTAAPKTSNDAKAVNKNLSGNYNDQLHIVVVDSGGQITGSIGQVLESYAFLSVAKDGKDDFGAATYYVNRVNNSSDWIKWSGHPLDGVLTPAHNWGSKTEGTVFDTYHKTISGAVVDYTAGRLSNGYGGDPIQDDDILAAIETFTSKEEVDVDMFITGWTYIPAYPLDYKLAISKMIKVAEARQDCVVCVSGDYGQIVRGYSKEADIAARFVSWRNGVYDSNYAFMDGNFKYQYDSYNDTYRWLPLSGDIAGLMAQTDLNFFPWVSPAGYTRGQIKNVVKLAFNPSQESRDTLYVNQINPVISVRGEGTMLFGDKTMQRIASAFDRINVRRLFITMKDFVVSQARRKLFEFNTPATRGEFRRLCEQYLETVVLQQGASEFRVICDETNNTSSIIEQNRFIADIYVRPNYVINFIKLNFTAVGQSVSFEDLGI